MSWDDLIRFFFIVMFLGILVGAIAPAFLDESGHLIPMEEIFKND